MSSIQSSPAYLGPTGGAGVADGAQAATGQTDVAALAAKVLDGVLNPGQLQEIAAGKLQALGLPGTGDAVTDSRGAPALAAPVKTFSADDMVALLRTMQTKSQDAQLASAKEGLETARIKAEKNTENQLSKIKEWISKCKEADSKGFFAKLFGWVGKIAAALAAVASVVVAAAATAATGGAAAPLLALAVVGMVGATIMLADQVSQEFGGPQISIGNLLQTVVGKFLEACGVDAEMAERIGKVMSGAMAMMVPVMLLIEPQLMGTMAEGVAKLAGASDDVAGKISMGFGIAAAVTVGIAMAVMSCGAGAGAAISRVGGAVVGAGSQILQGATSIAQGGVGIAVAADRRDAENAIAGKKELEADMVKLQQQMEADREELKKIIQQIEEGMQAVSKMISGAADSMAQITSNIGKRATV